MNYIKRFFSFYIDAFRNPGILPRRLFLIVFIKLFVLFVVLKIFLFPDFLKSRFSSEKEIGNYVFEELTNKVTGDE